MIRAVIALSVVSGSLAGPLPLPGQETPACDAPEARQFDFWIGDWEVVNRHRNPQAPSDTTWYPTGKAVNRAYAILDGCAVVEHWEGSLSFADILGFSVRAWDPEKEAWVLLLNWPGPNGPAFSTLEGGFEGGVGTFLRESVRPDGSTILVRYRFSEISRDSFRWDGANSNDDGETWDPFWIMDFERRDRVLDRALLVGPSRRVAGRCDGGRAREFDFLAGDWEGEETIETAAGPATRSVEIEAWPILEGCAVMDFTTVREGDRIVGKRFGVRSFVPAEDRWIGYTLDRERPILVRWEGSDSDGRTLVARGEGSRLERIRWLDPGPDRLGYEIDVSSDEGAEWRTVVRAELERRGG